ncbi:hypothetical protein E3Q18_02119 [Wallemia mellicola]|nr:hypothetical protein E3Q18_02119 [Wallemia mellicola]
MPRNSRSSGRSSASSQPRTSSFGSQETRQAHTAAPAYGQQRSAYAQQQAQPQQAPAAQPAATGAGGSFLGNVASTAAGVAAGHGLSNMLFGGSSSHQAPVEQPPAPVQQQSAEQKPVCETQAKDFVTCLNATGDVNSCSALLEMLKSCQAAAAPY